MSPIADVETLAQFMLYWMLGGTVFAFFVGLAGFYWLGWVHRVGRMGLSDLP